MLNPFEICCKPSRLIILNDALRFNFKAFGQSALFLNVWALSGIHKPQAFQIKLTIRINLPIGKKSVYGILGFIGGDVGWSLSLVVLH